MSRTDKDAPTSVRYANGSLPCVEYHDHIGGLCDYEETVAALPRKPHAGLVAVPGKVRRATEFVLDIDAKTGIPLDLTTRTVEVPAVRFRCSQSGHYSSRKRVRANHGKRRNRDSANLGMALREYNSFGELDTIENDSFADYPEIITD